MKVAETIEQSGTRVGAHAWAATRLFEAAGRWSVTVDDPRLRGLLGSASRRYGWHAELWYGLLPGLPHLGADVLVVPPNGQADLSDALTALDEVDTAGDADEVEALARRAVSAVIDDLERHLAVTTPVTDGPTIRVLALVLADLRADLDALRSWAARRERSRGATSPAPGAATP